MGFNPNGEPILLPVDDRWRAFYKNYLEGGLGSEVGIGRSATLWRSLDASKVSEYATRRMTQPPPFGVVIQAGDVVMSPILGGPDPLPCTYWTTNGKEPPDPEALNPSYAICMGQTGQVHFVQDCVGDTTIRIWACFVEGAEVDLQAQFVECFPYAQFDEADCGNYNRDFQPAFSRFVFAYCPLNRVKPALFSVPLTSMEPGGEQYEAMFG